MHRWGHEYGGTSGEQRGREQIVSETGGIASKQVGSRWGDDHQIGRLTQPRVRDHRVGTVELGLGRLRGQGTKGQSADESRGVLGQDRCHMAPRVNKEATQLDRLVGGDAARHAENDEGASVSGRHGVP